MSAKLYWNEDHTEYAVIVSPGYGSGFSTWNDDAFAYDARIVQWFMEHNDSGYRYKVGVIDTPENIEATKYFASLGYPYAYFGGVKTAEIRWVPAGAKWHIKEYDGAETLVYQDSEHWFCFE